MDIEIFEWIAVVIVIGVAIPTLIVMWLALYDELRKRWGK